MKNILLIESNGIHAELIQKSLLSGFGKIRITTVTSTEKALDALNNRKFDLILSDYYLPGSKGDGHIKKLIKKAPNIPIVVITGQGDEKIAARTIKAGVEDYIVKTREALEILPNILQRVLIKFRSQQASKKKEIKKFLSDQRKRVKKMLGHVHQIDQRVRRSKKSKMNNKITLQISSLKRFIRDSLLGMK